MFKQIAKYIHFLSHLVMIQSVEQKIRSQGHSRTTTSLHAM